MTSLTSIDDAYVCMAEQSRVTKRSTQAADSAVTYINIKRGGWVTARVPVVKTDMPGHAGITLRVN